MIKTRTGNWTLLAAALLLSAACGKKDDGAPPQLGMPAPGAAEKVAAQAEVKASSGPIELSLLLHKTEIKAGESLWQQIRIRNIGDKEIIVADRVFHEPRELRLQSRAGAGIYIEALGPDGKPLKVEFQESAEWGADIGYGVSGLLEVDGPEEQAMLDAWKKQGLSLREINEKLMEFNTKKQRAAEIHQPRPVIKLSPEQSAETKSAFFYSLRDKFHKRPIPRPIGDFAQLDFFVLENPGEYKVRAIYDRAPTPELNKMRGKLPISPWEVLVRTPWIKVTVAP